MKINITLFVQVINFFVTYTILNRLIFKPTLEVLKKREAEEKSLVDQIKHKEEKLYHKEEEKKEDLLTFQKRVKTEYAPPKKAAPQMEFKVAYKRNPKEINKITQKIKSLILEEVPRVR